LVTMDLGSETVARIDFYRHSSSMLMATLLAPLAFGATLALVMLLVSIVQGRSWLFKSLSDFSRPVAVLATAAILVLFVGIAAALVRSRARRNLKDFYTEKDYDQAEYDSWKNALEGVCIGLGMNPPVLKVLGVPTVNTIAFRESRKPGVGVTAEALKAGLSRSEKESMMAHEIAHIAIGDYFLASSSAGFEYAGYGLGVLFLLMAALVTVAINVYLLIFLLPLGLPLVIVLADRRLRKKTRVLYRHNDLLADTIAAKLTSDPECLRKTIEKLWSLSEATRAVIPRTAHFQGYLFISRPLESGPIKMVTYDGAAAAGAAGTKGDSTKIYWVPGKTETGTSFAYDSVKKRIGNLQAIEMGHWTELEKPNQLERIRNLAALSAVCLMMASVTLALFVPWHGTTAWHFATTNIVWKTTNGR